MTPPGNAIALVALGANQGDRRTGLETALARIRRIPGVRVRAVSRFYRTEPAGEGAEPGEYLNAAVRLEVAERTPESLLCELQRIEREGGRRPGPRNAARPLDLDLLLFGDRRIATPELTLPHPRMLERPFVMLPAAEVGGDLRHPVAGRTLAELAAGVGGGGILGVIETTGTDDADGRETGQ